MINTIWNTGEQPTITLGWRENPILGLFDEWTKGRMEVILSGQCPDCDNSLRYCDCPPESFQIQ